jgi:hypothetical protein
MTNDKFEVLLNQKVARNLVSGSCQGSCKTIDVGQIRGQKMKQKPTSLLSIDVCTPKYIY